MQLFDMDNYPKLKYYRSIIVTPEFVAKFESKVVRDDCMPDGCHIWTGHINRGGYGVTSIKGKSIKAHRASYSIYKGEIPHGMQICHRCDYPPCVNPAHLFLGSISDNMQDCVAKGRHVHGAKTHCPQGHEYLGENLLKGKNRNSRECRICKKVANKQNMAAFRQRQKAL